MLVACPHTALLDSKDYLAPIVTAFEAELAFAPGACWTPGEYRTSFLPVLDKLGQRLDSSAEAGRASPDDADAPGETDSSRKSDSTQLMVRCMSAHLEVHETALC